MKPPNCSIWQQMCFYSWLLPQVLFSYLSSPTSPFEGDRSDCAPGVVGGSLFQVAELKVYKTERSTVHRGSPAIKSLPVALFRTFRQIRSLHFRTCEGQDRQHGATALMLVRPPDQRPGSSRRSYKDIREHQDD